MSVKCTGLFLFDGLFRGCCISPHGERGWYRQSAVLRRPCFHFLWPIPNASLRLTCTFDFAFSPTQHFHSFSNYQPVLATTLALRSDAEECKHSWWKTPLTVFCRLTPHCLRCYSVYMYTLFLLNIWLRLNPSCYAGHVLVLRLCSEVFSRLALEQVHCELQTAAALTSILIHPAGV